MGFKDREEAAKKAWVSYSSRPRMTHDFRAGFHRASVDLSRPDVSAVMKDEITPGGFYLGIGIITGIPIGVTIVVVPLAIAGVLW